MKIIDCFTFYNELDMLFLRLTELNDVVDYFIIVESTHTHAGHEKDLFFLVNKNRYNGFLHKIIHIVVDDMPNTSNAWDNENHQRICIDRGIKKIELNDNDLIIISDCDEIPDSNTLKIIKTTGLNDTHSFEMDLYYYNMTCYVSKWYNSKIIPYSNYKHINNPEQIRMSHINKVIKNGGWHLSYFGNVEFIKNKIVNFSHQEFNNPSCVNDEISTKIENNKDILNRDIEFIKIEIEDNKYLPINYRLILNQ